MAVKLDDLDSAMVIDEATGKSLMGCAILSGEVTLTTGDISVSDVTIAGGTVHVEPGVLPLHAIVDSGAIKAEPGDDPLHTIVDSGAITATIPSRAINVPLGLVKVDSGNIIVDSVTAQVPAKLTTQASFSEDAVLTTSYAEDYITRGMGFEIQRRITLTAGQTLILELNIALATGKFVYALPLKMSTNLGNVFVDTYLADSSTGGAEIPPNNLNGLSAVTPFTKVKTGVTPTGSPTKLREYSIGISKTVQSAGGGVSSGGFPKILDNRKPLYIKFVNQETSTVTVDFGFVWYEI